LGEAPTAVRPESWIVRRSGPGISARLAQGAPHTPGRSSPRPTNSAAGPEEPTSVIAPGQGTPVQGPAARLAEERALARSLDEVSSQPPPYEAPRAAPVIPSDAELPGRDASSHPSVFGLASQDRRAVAVERGSEPEPRPASGPRPPLEPGPVLKEVPALSRPPVSFERVRQPSQGPPIVEISIGEIEVRAAPPPAPVPVRGPERPPFRPPMSLEEYLRRRAAGGR
jgi:hypothetical protein